MNVRGWKNVRMDMMTTWGQFKFEIGRTYIQEGEIELCKNGFHFHRNPFGLFTYYSFDLENVGVLEIEAGGVIVDGEDKSVCSEITIVRQLTLEQVKELGNMANNMGWGNTGDWNTGDLNTGDRNTGYWNTGDLNTGYRNTGYRNTGDWNRCDNSNGFFNSVEPETVLVFNKPCRIGVWQSARIPDFLYFEERWSDIKSYITKEGIEQLTALPNFDGEVFREVSGFSLDDLKYFEVLFRKF